MLKYFLLASLFITSGFTPVKAQEIPEIEYLVDGKTIIITYNNYLQFGPDIVNYYFEIPDIGEVKIKVIMDNVGEDDTAVVEQIPAGYIADPVTITLKEKASTTIIIYPLIS